MGDRTYHQIYIHDCPPEKVGIVLDKLDEYGFSFYGEADDQDGKALVLGECYHNDESYLGTTVNELIPSLIEQVPDIVLDGWEDPKYEFMGAGTRYAPGLGSFDYECGQSGAPLFGAEDVLKAVVMDENAREKFLGISWTKVNTPDDGTVLLGQPHCSECGERVDDSDPHAGYGMCGSCLHDALRSGWTPKEP